MRREKPMPRQAFVLSPDILASSDFPAVVETLEDMHKCGIASAPYSEFDIIVPAWWAMGSLSSDEFMAGSGGADPWRKTIIGFSGSIEMENNIRSYSAIVAFAPLAKKEDFLFPFGTTPFFLFPEVEFAKKSMQGATLVCATRAISMLIVMLATRGVSQRKIENKIGKLGIGKTHRRHAAITYINIDHGLYSDDLTATGRTIRPHLRRGHSRNQHFGPNNEFIKKVFVQPTWVNFNDASDEDGVPRRHYSIGKTA